MQGTWAVMLRGIKSWPWTSAEFLKGKQVLTSEMSSTSLVKLYYKPISPFLSLPSLPPPPPPSLSLSLSLSLFPVSFPLSYSEESPFRTMDTTKVSTLMHDSVGGWVCKE